MLRDWERVSVFVALVWLCIHRLIPQPIQIYGTFAIIALIFVQSMFILWQRGQIGIWSNLLQPLLFTTLYMQFYEVDSECYVFLPADYVPTISDWIQFTLAHILRASDILDIFEEYNIQLQSIQHSMEHTPVAHIVMFMHWAVDIFLISLAIQFFSKPLQTWWKGIDTRKKLFIFRGMGIISTTCAVIYLFLYSNHMLDWIFWPVDNLIRVLDVGDSFQLFDIRLYSMPKTNWLCILNLVFRIWLTCLLAAYAHLRLLILGGRGLTTNDLIDNFSNPSEHIRGQAVDTLSEIGAKAIPDLQDALTDPSLDVRQYAIKTLSNIAQKTELALPALIKALDDTNLEVRRYAVKILGDVGTHSTIGINALLHAMQDKNADIRKFAAIGLGNVRKNIHLCIYTLVQALIDTDSNVQKAAHVALNKIDKNWHAHAAIEKVIPTLIHAISNSNQDVRKSAVEVLGKIGSKSETAIIKLVIALTDSYSLVREYAVESLDKIDKNWRMNPIVEKAIPSLLKCLQNQERDIRISAAEVLGNIKAKQTIPALMKALHDEDNDVIVASVLALGNMGKDATEVIPTLTNIMHDSSFELKASAITALGNIATNAIVPDMITFSKDLSSDVRKAIAIALGKLGMPSDDVIKILLRYLNDTDADVRKSSAETLGKLGTKTAIIVSALEKALHDTNRDVCQSATNALEQLH